RVDDLSVTRPSAPVPAGSSLTVVDIPDGVEFASRAAHKLISALDTLGIDPSGLRCVDAGASTGGFSDVLLRRGAAHLSAVAIGHGQLAAHVRQDTRGTVQDGVCMRGLSPAPPLRPADLSGTTTPSNHIQPL